MSHTSEVKEYLQSLFEEDELLETKMDIIENELLCEDQTEFNKHHLKANYEMMALRRKELSKEIDLESAYYESHFVEQN